MILLLLSSLIIALPAIKAQQNIVHFTGPGVSCFNIEMDLQKTDNESAFTYWEWGKQEGWIKVNEFYDSYLGLLLDYLNNILYTWPEICETCDKARIASAVFNTDYSYMKEKYYLYAFVAANKSTIANSLYSCILGQYAGYISQEERSFLSSYFSVAVSVVTICPPPFNPMISWQQFAGTADKVVKFKPSQHLSSLSTMTRIGIRTRLPGMSYGNASLIDIKPSPPTFNITVKESCSNRNTGSLQISGATGVISSFLCVVKKSGYPGGDDYRFTGSDKTINDLSSGSYVVSLSYDDAIIGGCVTETSLEVESYAQLKIVSEQTDESCPEKNNGSIKVTLENPRDSYTISIDGHDPITSGGSFTGLDAGKYIIKATDFCYQEPLKREVEIYEPPIVTITEIKKTHPTCNSIPDGKFEIKASGGTHKYYFQLLDINNLLVRSSVLNATSPWNISELAGGSYRISVSSGGCAPVISGIHELTKIDPVTFTTSIAPVDCFGKNTGSIDVTASGGNHKYEYSIDNQAYTDISSFNSLGSGLHNIKVRSTAIYCDDHAEAKPFVGTAPKIEIVFSQVSHPLCFEKDDGNITANVTGGIQAYSYSWEQYSSGSWYPEPGSSNVLTGLYSGKYRLNIRDSKNCTESKEIVITEPQELIVTSATPTDAVCFGENGTINVQAGGGSGGYLYSNNESSGFTGSSTLNLPPGNYGIYVKDANGCLASYGETLTITGPVSPLDFTWSSPEFNSFNIACSGKATGSLSVLASGGNGLKNDGSSYTGYSYSLAGSPNQSSSLFSSLTAGSFNLKVMDGRGCIVQKQVTLTEPDPLTLNLVSSVPVKCAGDATGELIVAASGGIENTWVYSLDGTEMLTSGIFKNLQSRTYEIEVTDLNGCSKNMFAAVESPFSPINISAVKKDVSCFGEGNGEIAASVTGGAGGFSFTWEKQSGENWLPIGGTAGSRSDMLPGKYRVRATDSENCYRYEHAEIKEPSLLQITGVSSEDIVCLGETGSLHIDGSGGTGEYIYLYSAGGINYESSLPDIIVPAGVYTISLKDENECLAVHPQTLSITSPAEPLSFNYVLSDYSGYNISCHGKDDGIINVLASGGNGSAYSGYSYSITGRLPGSENIFTGLKAGIFDVTVSDARGCILTKPVTLLEPASLINLGASSIKRPVCVYDNNGAITLEASGGSLPYTYSINSGDFTESAEFTRLKADSYTFMVRDRNGCTENYNTKLTNVVSEMIVTGSIRDVGCYGESSGEINVSVTGGAKPYSYLWKEPLSTTPLVNKLKTGNYTVSITDSAGCIIEKMFLVNQPEKALSVSAISSPACVELENGLIEATGSGGTPPYSYSIGNRSGMGMSSSFNAYSGDHNIYISDFNNCLAETRVSVDTRNTMPDINFMLATSRYELDTLVVIDVSVPPPDRVTWEFSTEANVIETGNNKALVKYNSAGLYPVKMTGHFGSCPYTIEKLLNIAPFDPSVIPDKDHRDGIRSVKISPNPNDGRFELNVELYTRQKVTVRIFDMNSRILFTENYPPDITFLKEINLPEAVMPGTYVLHVTSENDSRTVVFVISE